MDQPALPRPRQVTLSGMLVTVGSVLMLALTFERISSLGSMDFQDQAASILAEDPFKGLGATVDDVQSFVRILCLVTGACAVSAAILGVYVLRRSRGSRAALSVVAPVLFLAGFVVASLPAAFVVAGIVMLWLPPARAWFDGRPAAPAARPAAPAWPPAPQLQSPQLGAGSRVPPRAPFASGPRPSGVLAACVLTWVSSAIVSLMALLTLLALLADTAQLLDQLRPTLTDAGLSDHEFLVGVYVLVAVLVPWCAAASVLAVAAYRRTTWGWVGLMVCAGAAALVCLLAVLGNLVAVLPMAACLITLSLLLRPEARAWFTR